MTRDQRRIVEAWADCVATAIAFDDADAAQRLAIAFVRRLRELGIWS